MHADGAENANDRSEDPKLPAARGRFEPARAIEMAYWSEEPGLLEIIRAVVCLSPETRTALLAFLLQASDARRISAARNHGDLVLSLM